MAVFRPKSRKIDLLIAEEAAKIEALQARQAIQPLFEPELPPDIAAPRFDVATPVRAQREFQPFAPIDIPEVRPIEQPAFRPTQFLTPSVIDTDREFQSVTPTPIEDVAWWEQPKALVEKVGEKIGRTVAKAPILPEILKPVGKVFSWIHENLEKPWAAITLGAFAPDLEWKKGESWLDHKKREFDAWEAPTYVKGIAEFSMPLWWMPWFAWARAGSKALSVGSKVTAELSKGGKMIRVGNKNFLPPSELLDVTLFKAGNLRKAMAGIPVVNKIAEKIGGVGVFIDNKTAKRISQLVDEGKPLSRTEDLVRAKMELVKLGFISSMRNNVNSLFTPRLQVLESASKGLPRLLGMDSKGLVTNIVDKSGKSQALYDVLEGAMNNPKNYIFKGDTKKYVDTLREVVDDIRKMAQQEGIKVSKDRLLHRVVLKIPDEIAGKMVKTEYGSLIDIARVHKTMREGIDSGVEYGLRVTESVTDMVNHYVKAIARKRFEKGVGRMGQTPLAMFGATYPQEAAKIANLLSKIGSYKFADNAITRVSSFAGSRIPSATMRKIRTELPNVGEAIDVAFKLRPDEVTDIIGKVSRSMRAEARESISEFKDTLTTISRIADAFKSEKNIGKILRGEIDDAVGFTNIRTERALKVTEAVYKEAYILRKTAVNSVLKNLRGQIDNLSKAAKGELTDLKKIRTGYTKHLEGLEVPRLQLAKFAGHPAFKNKLFPTPVVRSIEKILNDNSQAWLRASAGASGLSRMLVAAMDLSSPFIQGLAVAGRNPVVWGGMVKRNLEFFTKPENFFKWMDDPANRALRTEMVSRGSTASSFEFFDALKPLQIAIERVTDKFGVPQIGRGLQKIIGETYGRAEVAFTGGGIVARANMWKALRHKSLKADGTLDDVLAMDTLRTLDRMTGVMSLEALSIGRTQQDFETAFMFFSPRYTRSGLSFVSDVLKGGMAGAEARTSLGALMAGGLAMYYGTTKALGQAPNLNPSSGRFLTVQIGDSHIGIGGIMIALMRFGFDVGMTALEDPINLVKPLSEGQLNRWDNPFIRFMFTRTAPLTSTLMGTLVEQANYFGEPFEDVEDWARFMADKITPIAVQGIMDDPRIEVAITEFAGLRVFPRGPWELLDEKRDEVSIREHGQPYENLNDLLQTRIDKMEEILSFREEVNAVTEIRGDELSVGFLRRERERDSARTVYEGTLHQLAEAYDAGAIDGIRFREGVSDAGYGLGTTYEHIDTQPEYKDVLEKLREPRRIQDRHTEDIAYAEFMDTLFETDAAGNSIFEDEFGIFQYDKHNEFLEGFRAKYGEEIYQYILARKAERDENLPELAKELQRAKELMKPYWQIRDRVEKLFGKAFAESPAGQRLIAKQRKLMRMTNPEIAEAYAKFYERQ